jgi:hypothetical protein
MALQKAIKAPKPTGLRLVAEPPGAHQCNVVAHQIAKDTAEGRELAQRFEHPIRLGREQRSHDRLAAFHTVLSAQIGDGIAGDQPLMYKKVEEAINDACTVEQC